MIRCLKAQYRRRLGKLLLHQEATNQVSLWEGLMMLRASWAIDVKQDVILNAWSKSGLAGKNKQVEENEIDETHPDIEKMADIEEEEATSAAPLVDVDEIMNAFIQDVDSMEPVADNKSIEQHSCVIFDG